MALMGFREYARHRGVTLRAVQKAIEAGRIATVLDGERRRIDADEADRDWIANTDPAAQSLLYSAGPALVSPNAATVSSAAAASRDPPDAAVDDERSTELAVARSAAATGGPFAPESNLTIEADRGVVALPVEAGADAAADDEPAPADQTSEYRTERAKRERIRREREEIELEELRGNYVRLDQAELAAFTAFRTLRDSMLQIAVRIKDRCAAAADPFVVEQIIEAEIAATFGRFDPSTMLLQADDDDEAMHDAA